MSKHHVPTLSNLDEALEDDEAVPYPQTTRQHSYPLTSPKGPTSAANARFQLASTYSSPSVLPPPLTTNVSSTSSRSDTTPDTRRGDVYAQFMRRYRQPGASSPSSQSNQGLGSLLDAYESDDEDSLTISRLATKSVDDEKPAEKFPQYDEWVEPANQEERERLEWQAMLTSVLDGDVLKSEKTRIANALEAHSSDHNHYRHRDIWLELKANLRGITLDDQRRILEDEKRQYVDTLIQDIMTFRIQDHKTAPPAVNQVGLILRRMDAVEDLYPTLRALCKDKPLYMDQEFQVRRDALITWINTASSLKHQIASLKSWTGSETLDVTQQQMGTPGVASSSHRSLSQVGGGTGPSTFVERVLKEDSMQRMFEKKTLTTLHSFLISIRESLVAHAETFGKLNLPSFEKELVQLISFPSRLVEAILRTRLEYAWKVNDPEPLIIDQMTDDFRIAIGLACTIRFEYDSHIQPSPFGGWNIPRCISEQYDDVIVKAVRFLFKLISWKFKATALEDVDIMEPHGSLFDEVSVRIHDGSWVVAEELCSLTVKLIMRVMSVFNSHVRLPEHRHSRKGSKSTKRQRGLNAINGPSYSVENNMSPTDERVEERLLSWYSRTLEEIRLPHGKLMRFARLLMQRFCNACEFDLLDVDLDAFVKRLASAEYFLVYSKSFEDDGVYIIAHPSLKERPETITQMLRKAYHVEELFKQRYYSEMSMQSEEASFSDEVASVILMTPTNPFIWPGYMMVLDEPRGDFNLTDNRARLIADGPQTRLNIARENFVDLCSDAPDTPIISEGGLECLEEQMAHLEPVNRELRRVAKSLTKMTEAIVTSVSSIREALRHIANSPELVAQWFIFASEHGQHALKYISSGSRVRINNMLTRLAISWVAFICDECDHTDRKTFRWAVMALEFALSRTRRNNILNIPLDQFNLLRQKVATCMTLLISHFDILGARSSIEMKQEKMRAQELRRIQALEGRTRLYEVDSISRPPTPEQGQSSLFGPLNSTFKRKTRLDQEEALQSIDEVEAYRIAVETEQHMIGRVLDIGKPEDRSLVDLVSSTSHISMRWQQGRFIGAGAFGTVYQAINLNTGSVMAVKEVRIQEVTGSNLFRQIKDELAVMELLHHPNVVEFYGIEAHRDRVYIFEEYCQGGSLAALLEHGRVEDEGIMQVYTLQMLEGLIYLHSKGIVHRDLKPDNILLDHMGVIKFVDFGAAKVLAKNQRTIQRTRRGANPSVNSGLTPGMAMNNSLTGTPMYMAPEVIRNDKRGRHGAMDIWSLGCVALECATGRKPWSNLDNEWAIMFHIGVATKHPPLPEPDQLSTQGIDFIRRCLTLDPLIRPSAVELVDHVWMLDFRAQLEEYEQGDASQLSTEIVETEKGVVAQQAASIENQKIREIASKSPSVSDDNSSSGTGSEPILRSLEPSPL